MRLPRAFCLGSTAPEIIIVCVVAASFLVMVATLFIGATTSSYHSRGGQQTQTLSNMKQLHLATQQMALDRTTDTNLKCGWPGDMDGSFTNWAHELVAGSYLSTNDLCKLLSAPGRLTPLGAMPSSNNNGIIVYNVAEATDGRVVFLTSANFTNTATGGLPALATAKPYGQKGFVIFHKGGDGMILANRQAGVTNLVGGFVPLCK